MKKIIVIIAGIALVAVSSCSKKPDIGGTSAESMANEWWVTIADNTGDLSGHLPLHTYNTAANSNEMWVDDDGNIWDFKIKATADFKALTFSAAQAVSVVPGYDIKVDITEGKVLPNLGRSKSGNVTDSIYMKIKFEDDPRTFTLKGHARTRFAEDEY